VILHSANQSAKIWLDFGVIKPEPPADLEVATYSPENSYGLLLNSCNEEWWGWADAQKTNEITPTEKRVLETIEWVTANYPVDRDRIYLEGVSMGGCGSLGIGGARGDIFAAIKVFVPAGTGYIAKRMGFGEESGKKLPDPPVIVDLSAPNDTWSKGQEVLLDAARKYRIPLVFGWGPFGHNGAPSAIRVHAGCGAVLAFPWLTIRKNEAYPVFTDASSDQRPPWSSAADKADAAGQINAWFRWKNEIDTPTEFVMRLWIDRSAADATKNVFPDEAVADVTLRRLQKFQVAPHTSCKWKLVRETKTIASGTIQPDADGLLTIPKVRLTAEPADLRLETK